MRPNFIVIGAAKSGTTTLCHLLGKHPEVFMLPNKESHFFNWRYDRGWDWYQALFHGAKNEIAVGEGSPDYTMSVETPRVAERIQAHLPAARLIYIVRHPIRRIESHFFQAIDNGLTCTSMADAIQRDSEILEGSFYWKRINDFRRFFPDDQICVLFVDDLRTDQKAVLRKCFDFLGVDPQMEGIHDHGWKNTRSGKRTDRSTLRWMRKSKLFNDVHQAMPRWAVESLKPLFRKKIGATIDWEPELQRRVTNMIAEDTRQFLSFYGKPEEFWDLSVRACQ